MGNKPPISAQPVDRVGTRSAETNPPSGIVEKLSQSGTDNALPSAPRSAVPPRPPSRSKSPPRPAASQAPLVPDARPAPGNHPSIPPNPEDCPVAVGDLLKGKYKIEKIIGAGGMGIVVAASHLELGQRVAIKFVHQKADQRFDAVRRFKAEARVAATIQSQHVARVFDVDVLESGVAYIVMECLQGYSVSQELRQRKTLPVTETVDIVLQAIDALVEAHAARVVHRDLKPANLFLHERLDGSRIVKVLDFGISKQAPTPGTENEEFTQAGIVMGSPRYAAPEQLSNSPDVDARADIWSLGAIMYKLLSGTVPFSATTNAAFFAALLRDPPPPMTKFRNDVPAEVVAVVERCLAKLPEDRFQNVADLADALAPFASPRFHEYAERAARVLEVTGANSTHGSVDVTRAERTSKLEVTGATRPSPELPVDARSEVNVTRAPAPRRTWYIAAVALAASAAGLGLWWSMRSDDSAAASSTKNLTPPSAVQAAPEALSEMQEPNNKDVTSTPDEGSRADEVSSPPAHKGKAGRRSGAGASKAPQNQESMPPSTELPTAGAPSAGTHPTAPAAPPKTITQAPAPGSKEGAPINLSDFGGRN